MYRATCRALAVLLLLLPGRLWAHHSFAATFDLSRTVTITGTLATVDWRNPHMEFVVEVTGEAGLVKAWLVQGASINAFRNRNITGDDFERAIGHTLTVEAHPAKEGSRYDALAARILFPDGRSVALKD